MRRFLLIVILLTALTMAKISRRPKYIMKRPKYEFESDTDIDTDTDTKTENESEDSYEAYARNYAMGSMFADQPKNSPAAPVDNQELPPVVSIKQDEAPPIKVVSDQKQMPGSEKEKKENKPSAVETRGVVEIKTISVPVPNGQPDGFPNQQSIQPPVMYNFPTRLARPRTYNYNSADFGLVGASTVWCASIGLIVTLLFTI